MKWIVLNREGKKIERAHTAKSVEHEKVMVPMHFELGLIFVVCSTLYIIKI